MACTFDIWRCEICQCFREHSVGSEIISIQVFRTRMADMAGHNRSSILRWQDLSPGSISAQQQDCHALDT
jgi:hypothetical protein